MRIQPFIKKGRRNLKNTFRIPPEVWVAQLLGEAEGTGTVPMAVLDLQIPGEEPSGRCREAVSPPGVAAGAGRGQLKRKRSRQELVWAATKETGKLEQIGAAERHESRSGLG